MTQQPYRIVCFLARQHGLAGLKTLLSPRAKDEIQYIPSIVFTHSLLPKSEDPARGLRPEYEEYKQICQKHDIPLYSIDTTKQAQTITALMQQNPCDLIASISWRRLIPKEQLDLPRIGGVNLHRGALPEYAGAEPIKQALAKGEKEIYITAHILEEEIDAGPILATAKHPVNYDDSQTTEQNIERLKVEITPYFGPLLLQALDACI